MKATWRDVPGLLVEILAELRGLRRDTADLLRSSWRAESGAAVDPAVTSEAAREGALDGAKRGRRANS